MNDSYCGPAVIEMLLANLGIFVDQRQVVIAGGAISTIDDHGMTVQQLATSVGKLSAGTQFWVKEHAELHDINVLINDYQIPVAVEWQGLFEDNPSFASIEDHEADYGHYSIITTFDTAKNQLIIVDPYKDFIHQDRIFNLSDFLPRWWDTNLILDLQTGTEKLTRDEQFLFIITRNEDEFPTTLNMHPWPI